MTRSAVAAAGTTGATLNTERPIQDIFGSTIKLIDFTGNLAAKLGADPGGFGTTAERVAEYVVTRDRWINARQVAAAEATRTAGNLALAEAARKTLVSSTRSLVRELQAWPQMTDPKRRELRITVPDRTRTPVATPTEAPGIELVQAVRHTVRLKIVNPDGARRRPAGTAGANVFYAVGPNVPASPADWAWSGFWTRGTHDVVFPLDTPAGATVWLSAAYANPRGENGPMADAVSTNLPGGQAVRVAA